MFRKYLIIITVIVATFYLLNSQQGKKPFTLVRLESVRQNPQREISEKVDRVLAYFEQMEDDASFQKKYFTSDFKMTVNGEQVIKNRDELTERAKKTLGLSGHFRMIEKISTDDACVLQYDVENSGVNKKKVMAICKFRKGKIYEMNEVLFTAADD